MTESQGNSHCLRTRHRELQIPTGCISEPSNKHLVHLQGGDGAIGGKGGKASDPAQDKPYGCLGTQMEKVRARGSGDGGETTWPSSDLATGAETRALPPFPSVSMDQPGTLACAGSHHRGVDSLHKPVRDVVWGCPPHKEHTVWETAHLQGLQDGNRQSTVCHQPRMQGWWVHGNVKRVPLSQVW